MELKSEDVTHLERCLDLSDNEPNLGLGEPCEHGAHRRVAKGGKPPLQNTKKKNKFDERFLRFETGERFFNFPGLNDGKAEETPMKPETQGATESF